VLRPRRRESRGPARATIACVDADYATNELGVAPARGRPRADVDEIAATLTDLIGEQIEFSDRVVAYSSPKSCPACGASNVVWGCDETIRHGRDEIHPLVWHESEWMADSFICSTCWAGWIEPDQAAPISWVRPYWTVR
jgi:hypothetical protein